jgi:arsenical pump membrane protein
VVSPPNPRPSPPGPDAVEDGSASRARSFSKLQWLLLVVGAGAALASLGSSPSSAAAAARQDWPPFVLVAGLLLIGLVAAEDGLFEAAGQRLARVAPDGRVLFVGVAGLVVAVTAVLNLDTSVAFLTPVIVHTARRRQEDGAALLCGCVLLSNAGSLLLPGSNLTNLIVLGQLHLAGGTFLARMALPWAAAVIVTAAVVGVAGRRQLRQRRETPPVVGRPDIGVGLAAVAVAAALVVVLPNPALPVAAIGVVAVVVRVVGARLHLAAVGEVLGVPVLVGLFGVAMTLGTVGRVWSGPARLLTHLDPWSTGVVAAVATVLVNNLPAASLLAARVPPHPFALLVGLNLGPNLFVTGSLAWVLWWRAARMAGTEPSIGRATRIGAVAVPLSLAAALAALTLVGRA